jgi:hypothetical protein
MSERFDQLLARAEQLMGRIEAVLPQPLPAPDWDGIHCVSLSATQRRAQQP